MKSLVNLYSMALVIVIALIAGAQNVPVSVFPARTANPGDVVTAPGNQPGAEIVALEAALGPYGQFAGIMNVVMFGADPTGAKESVGAFQNAVNRANQSKSCVYVPPGTYRITGTITGPPRGQACIRGFHNNLDTFGNPPGDNTQPASTLIEYQANAKVISLTGAGNLIEGLEITNDNGAAGVTAIYGTDNATQQFTHNRIDHNMLHGYYAKGAQGTFLASGIDIESVGANSNWNEFIGNVAVTAKAGYIFHGASFANVVNANYFDGMAFVCTDAMLMTNSGENTIILGMEGNTRGVTSSGWGLNSFYLGRGEQRFPHLRLTNGAHDNTLWEPSRAQITPGQSAMVTDSTSTVNSELDMGAAWFGVSTAVPGRRFLCLFCIGPTGNYPGDRAGLQIVRDSPSSMRPAIRVTDPLNGDAFVNFQVSPAGTDPVTNVYGLWFETDHGGSFDRTKALQTLNLSEPNGPAAITDVARTQYMVSGRFRGTFGCSAASGFNATTGTDCEVGVQKVSDGSLVYPVSWRGDGTIAYPQVIPSSEYLPTCVQTSAASNQASVGTVLPNYPYATSNTYGAPPGSGGKYNVSVRCDFDGTNYAWHIH